MFFVMERENTLTSYMWKNQFEPSMPATKTSSPFMLYIILFVINSIFFLSIWQQFKFSSIQAYSCNILFSTTLKLFNTYRSYLQIFMEPFMSTVTIWLMLFIKPKNMRVETWCLNISASKFWPIKFTSCPTSWKIWKYLIDFKLTFFLKYIKIAIHFYEAIYKYFITNKTNI